MTFANSARLFALLGLPVAILVFWLIVRFNAKRANAWSSPSLRPNIIRSATWRLRWIPLVMYLLGSALLLVGFARPEQHLSANTLAASTVVLSIDTSGSMAARDVPGGRIATARDIALKILRVVPAKDRVALVEFGSQAKVVVPPTFDRQELVTRLPLKASHEGTALGDAITKAVALAIGDASQASSSGGRQDAVILLSDGDQTLGGSTPTGAALSAVSADVPISTVVIGTRRGVVTQRKRANGLDAFVEIAVPSDAKVLKIISKQTGGETFAADGVEHNPRLLASAFGHLSPLIVTRRTTRHWNTITGIAAIILLALGVLTATAWRGGIV